MSVPVLDRVKTPADLKKMRELAKKKMSARLAAKELGRSTGAVKYKAMVEGIRFRFIDQPAGVSQAVGQIGGGIVDGERTAAK